jgi:hypothetical protein
MKLCFSQPCATLLAILGGLFLRKTECAATNFSTWRLDEDHSELHFGAPAHCQKLGAKTAFWARPGRTDLDNAEKHLVANEQESAEAPLRAGGTTQIDFTLVSQCSFNRLWMLRHICTRWPGDIMLAVMLDLKVWKGFQIPLPKECRNTFNGKAGRVRSVTLLPYLNPEDDKSTTQQAQFYPVNALRNYALCNVTTSHIFYTDMDLWPSGNLYDRLHLTKDMYPNRFRHPKHATVIPAFTLISSPCKTDRGVPCENVDKSVPRNFEDLKSCVIKKHCHVFDRSNYEGHATTDYRNWVFSKQKTFRLLTCIRSNRYEPYLVLPASPSTPLFDETFTGYGKNKIQHVVHLRLAGFQFSVLSYAYVIHFPHAKSKARLKWDYRRRNNNEAVNEVDIQYQAFLSWLKDTYKGPKTPICTKELLEKQRKSKSDGKNKKKTKKKGSGHIHSHERSNDNSTVVEQVAEEEMATDESEEQEQSRAGNIIEEAGWRAGVAGFGS